jgi:hypothetical protein
MQQIDVRGMTVNPFPAIQQPSQLHQLVIERHPARVLDRVAGTDLVGDRADAAYTRGDVRRLGVGAAAQECLEEPRRLVDVQLDAFTVPSVNVTCSAPSPSTRVSAPTVSVRVSEFTGRSARRRNWRR